MVFAPAAVQVLSESSSALTWQARRGFVGFENLEGMSGSSPACPSHLLSLAVIIYYTIFRVLSIDILHQYSCKYLFIITLVFV